MPGGSVGTRVRWTVGIVVGAAFVLAACGQEYTGPQTTVSFESRTQETTVDTLSTATSSLATTINATTALSTTEAEGTAETATDLTQTLEGTTDTQASEAALSAFSTQLSQVTASADAANSVVTKELDTGTTLRAIAPKLSSAVNLNQKAAAAITGLAGSPDLPFRDFQHYRAALAAAYSTQADAWTVLLNDSQNGSRQASAVYYMLARQAAGRHDEAGRARSLLLVDLAQAPEGSAS